MNKLDIEHGVHVCTQLREHGFSSVLEASIFYLAADAQLKGREIHIANIVEELNEPFSTISRVTWSLRERGLLRYEDSKTDRRMKIVRAVIP